MVTTGLLIAACGDAEPSIVEQDDNQGPLGTLRGTVSTPDTSGWGQQISMAVLWVPSDEVEFTDIPIPDSPDAIECTGEADPKQFVQEKTFERRRWIQTFEPVSFDANFPIRFEIPIEEPPPLETLNALFGYAEFAIGRLVVFIDSNRNGALDLPSANLEGDEILALPQEVTIYYMDPEPGIEVFLEPDETGTEVQIPDGLSFRIANRFTSPASGVDIQISTEPADRKTAEHAACTSIALRDEFGAPVPSNLNPELTRCSEDGRYVLQATDREIELDRTCVLTKRVVEACLEPGSPRPEGWPCRPN